MRSHSPFSRVLQRLDHLVAHSAAAGVVGAVVGAFIVALAIAGFPESWEVAFSTLAAAVTLVMVFVLHHTQRREQVATQLKLDELIRALRRPTTTTCGCRRPATTRSRSSRSATWSTTEPLALVDSRRRIRV